MRQNIDEFQKFYASRMGRMVRLMVTRRLQALWPDRMHGQDILGFGYAGPYLSDYFDQAQRIILAMPGEQGAIVTRAKRGGIVCLTEETELPFPPASFDHILVAHGLADSPDLPALMDELWRVMKPEGRLVILASNRVGLWARSDLSPFGQGRPFSRSQLAKLLRQARFEPRGWAGAVYTPPLHMMSQAGLALTMERFGETVWPRFSGLILVEAIKRIYADIEPASGQKSRSPSIFGVPGIERPSSNFDRTDLCDNSP